MRTALNDRAMADHDDLVGMLDGAQPVGNND